MAHVYERDTACPHDVNIMYSCGEAEENGDVTIKLNSTNLAAEPRTMKVSAIVQLIRG